MVSWRWNPRRRPKKLSLSSTRNPSILVRSTSRSPSLERTNPPLNVENVAPVDDEEEEVDVVEEEDLEPDSVTPTTPPPPTTLLKTLETKTPTTANQELLNPMLVDLLKGIEDHSDEEEEEETVEVEMLEARALLKEELLLTLPKLDLDKDPTLVDPQERDAPEDVSTTANAILPRMTAALLLPRPFSWPTSLSLWTTRVSSICSRI
jgi:hypothetical protein